MNKAIQDIPYSLGQTSFGAIALEGLEIRSLAIDGVVPSVTSVEGGTYKMIRNYGIVFPNEGLNDSAQLFVDFISSPEVQMALTGDYGFGGRLLDSTE